VTEGKAAMLKEMQDETASRDSVGVCNFISNAITPEQEAAMYAAATGESVDIDAWMTLGERVWTIERLFNNRAGLGRADDSLPPRMTHEPLTGASVQNQVVELEPMLEDYYRVRGWDAEGNPTAETLRRLGIE